MSDFSNAFSIAASGMKAQAMRLRHVSENIANVDTPGYHRKTVSFEEAMHDGAPSGAVSLGEVQLDRRGTAREAQRSYEANLRMFDQTRQMSSALLDLLRR